MKQKITLLYNYCIYRIKSVDEHGVHSPFIFDLVTNVIYNDKAYYSYKSIEKLKDKLLNSDNQVEGKRISQLAAELKPAKCGQLLFRLVNYFQPEQVIEIGTSLGIETAYMASANTHTKIITLERSEQIAGIAKENFKQLGLKNIESINDAIERSLPNVINKTEYLDFVYIKGEAQNTLHFFDQCLGKIKESSVFVISDLYSSPEMKAVWTEIKNKDIVKVTIDLFYFGIVFFRKEQVKEHFVIRF